MVTIKMVLLDNNQIMNPWWGENFDGKSSGSPNDDGYKS